MADRLAMLRAQREAEAERQEKLLASEGPRLAVKRWPKAVSSVAPAPLRNALRNPSRNAATLRNAEPRHVTPEARPLKPGRPPLGDQAMTPAERQARYRRARAERKAKGEAKS